MAGTPNRAAAKRFIDYALSAKTQKAFTESMFYAPSKARAQISEAAISQTAVRSMDKMLSMDWVEIPKIRDPANEQWRRKVIPLSR